MRLILTMLSAALLVACADMGGESLPAPTPKAVMTHVTAADAGKVVLVAVNRPFAVELVGVPTAGYLWAPAITPAFLTKTGEASGPTITAQKQPGFTGGNHWEVTIFTAKTPGRGELTFEQRRPWELNQPPADTFSVTIEAK